MLIAAALGIGLVAAGLVQDAARSSDYAGTAGLAGSPAAATGSVLPLARPESTVSLVQALPGAPVRVEVDGRTVGQQVPLGKVLGPLRLAAGSHEVRFVGSQGAPTTSAMVTVTAGVAHDVVLHAPATANGAPVVTVYPTPVAPIAGRKARVLLAHTAEVGPADIWVDGQRAFTHIANGQFAQADVPAGVHRVAIRPAGQTGATPVLGPLDVDLAQGTVTLAYAVGNPADKSMTVVAHVVRLEADGSIALLRIHTGSAGSAAGVTVHGFGRVPSAPHAAGRRASATGR